MHFGVFSGTCLCDGQGGIVFGTMYPSIAVLVTALFKVRFLRSPAFEWFTRLSQSLAYTIRKVVVAMCVMLEETMCAMISRTHVLRQNRRLVFGCLETQ